MQLFPILLQPAVLWDFILQVNKVGAYTPPQYDVVAKTKTVCEDRTRYVPPEYGVIYRKELYACGHWEWKAKYGCEDRCKKPCPQKPVCLPGPGGCGCDCRGIPAAD